MKTYATGETPERGDVVRLRSDLDDATTRTVIEYDDDPAVARCVVVQTPSGSKVKAYPSSYRLIRRAVTVDELRASQPARLVSSVKGTPAELEQDESELERLAVNLAAARSLSIAEARRAVAMTATVPLRDRGDDDDLDELHGIAEEVAAAELVIVGGVLVKSRYGFEGTILVTRYGSTRSVGSSPEGLFRLEHRLPDGSVRPQE